MSGSALCRVALCLGFVVVAFGGGCGRGTARCNEGTVFFTVTLQGVALTADRIEVRTTIDGAAGPMGSVPRRAGENQGTVEIALGGRYRQGAELVIVALAHSGTRLLAEGRAAGPLEPGCSVRAVNLGAAVADAGDARPADGPRPADGGGVDSRPADSPTTDAAEDGPPSVDAPADGPADGASDLPPDLSTGPCPGVCTPPMTMACGRCGTRACTANCAWGACLNQGVCEPMATEACGRCLSGRRTCTAACGWGACQNEVGCVPTMTRPCEGCPGLTQTCSRECTWTACSCPAPKRVFVTRDRFTGAMGGLLGAHAFCTRAANAAGLTGNYRAWLSSATQGPAAFMIPSPGPYVLPRGEVVAQSWADLVDGTLARAIDRDERGDPANTNFVCEGGEVWTNTTPAGAPRGVLDCGGWTTELGTSATGNVKFANLRWTDSGCNVVTCASALNLYCFEQ